MASASLKLDRSPGKCSNLLTSCMSELFQFTADRYGILSSKRLISIRNTINMWHDAIRAHQSLCEC
jgi:hypothetical protein